MRLPELPAAALFELRCRHCDLLPLWTAALDTFGALRRLADALGYWPTITSGYRCPKHNAVTRGAHWNSAHQVGRALDIAVPKEKQSAVVTAAQRAGFTFVEANARKGYVHCELRP